MLQALRSKPQPRWPERALTNAFVRNVAQAGRYCVLGARPGGVCPAPCGPVQGAG